ncbi:signal transduction protein [Acrocarpospora phusangensis]|uniref:Signal transduction protein n=2 Tax=Acrocarpospora phusangensis TaxID=1070424 RepID=A0A919UPW1_9ACTN|nr:signal transduction protein [Acrocarpospora phusangensis]
MTPNAECAGMHESVNEASEKMARLGVGALPICGDDDRLKGMITDRDIVVKVLAQGKDPKSCLVEELAQGKPVTIGADDDAMQVLRTMADHKIRRLPVIDGKRLAGIVTLADVARAMPNNRVGDLLEALSTR